VRTGAGAGYIGSMIPAVRRMIGTDHGPDLEAQSASLKLLSGASLVVAQGRREGAPNSVVTVVSSPNAGVLNSAVACLVEPGVWSHLAGGISMLDATTGAITATEPEGRRYVATQEFSVGNERLMMAGWLSLNPRVFAMIAFLLALPLAVTTHFLVRNVGRRSS
jgi:cellulose synthase operon protein B